jgi:hypothetical protein
MVGTGTKMTPPMVVVKTYLKILMRISAGRIDRRDIYIYLTVKFGRREEAGQEQEVMEG